MIAGSTVQSNMRGSCVHPLASEPGLWSRDPGTSVELRTSFSPRSRRRTNSRIRVTPSRRRSIDVASNSRKYPGASKPSPAVTATCASFSNASANSAVVRRPLARAPRLRTEQVERTAKLDAGESRVVGQPLPHPIAADPVLVPHHRHALLRTGQCGNRRICVIDVTLDVECPCTSLNAVMAVAGPIASRSASRSWRRPSTSRQRSPIDRGCTRSGSARGCGGGCRRSASRT